MDFKNKSPEWKNEGAEPSDELKNKGFQPGYKPPAAFFNWFWSLVSKCITEIQHILGVHTDDKSIHWQISMGDKEPTGNNYLWFAPYKPQETTDEIILQSADYSGNETKLHIEVDGKLNTVDNSDINGENVILFE